MLHIVNADCFFDRVKFPEVWHTVVEDKSSKMSGGERQRLVLARALLRPSRVLLLDEAFSALDLKNRSRVEVCSPPSVCHSRTIVWRVWKAACNQ